jgi:mRNA interferase MazF
MVMFNDRQNKAMADQLTTVSKLRLINRAGTLTNTDMRKVDHAVKVQLGLLDTALQT